jgi:hypothetical protein
MESFLKEQLKRIQELTARMSSLQEHAAELSREMEREREQIRGGPLCEVRDLRTYSGREPERDTANERPARTPRRRRRRR